MMKKTVSNRPLKQAGFVLTIEAVLIATILGIGLFVGIVAVRDAIFKYKLSQQDQDFYVFDSTDPAIVIGKVSHFDEHEAPVVPFIDYGVRTDANGNPINHRALIGVRDDRFTSRQPIFYSGPACTGTPCIAGPSNEAAYNTGVDGIDETGGVGYLYGLQGITYGIGAGVAGALKGRLYRQSTQACGAGNFSSFWDSQRVVTGAPCVNLAAAAGTAGFFLAEQVERTPGENVLDPLTPRFYTNMVPTPSTTYQSVPPADENTTF